MSNAAFGLYELDDSGEGNGVIHFFCSEACRAASELLGMEALPADAIQGNRCETCGEEWV